MTPLEEFLGKHGGTPFRHSRLLVPGLRSGRWVLEDHPRAGTASLPCRHFREVYQLRYRRLDEPDPGLGPYLRAARADALALCEEAARTPGEPVEVWSFFMAPYLHLDVFVAGRSQRVLGCVRGVDSQHEEEAEADEEVRRTLALP
ncbi:MAG: hypothetical protein AVDCRST_MAG59-3122 [uncultured Thermomicrobiales bacterium]|uniref:Uncharacterized protein n=1 Tax=uncultured Thermomicrobiales bacterium TaxID=1645740 RepID=A0A6J4V3H7_9BACT|nr:MAG: hypothetical protein AVDCRST_MAG59-3122 [uncultured Thermomicrobiales bacterium]